MSDTPEIINIGERKFKVFIDEERLLGRVRTLGRQIAQDYRDRVPYFLLILKGSFVFGADLVRAYGRECEVGFVRLSSYDGTSSTGKVSMDKLQDDLTGKHVIVVEDIIDTGLTMKQFLKSLSELNPASIAVASLFVKPEALQHEVPVDYKGFDIPNAFIVGYGLDLDEKGRNLRQIYQLVE